MLAELNLENQWTEARCREWWDKHKPDRATA